MTVDGIVQVTPSDLSAAGVDPATVDPRTFAMSSMGQPVAIQVTGEADGQFDDADAFTFFGQKFRGTEFQEKYTDERVYWLDIGGTAGPRIADVDATPQGDLTPPQRCRGHGARRAGYDLDSALDPEPCQHHPGHLVLEASATDGDASRLPLPWTTLCPIRRRAPRRRFGRWSSPVISIPRRSRSIATS